jgi:hypothetical protein
MTEEEINQFFLDNRTKSLDTNLSDVYDDSANAPTFYGSTLPVNKVAQNLQSNSRLEPYNPSLTDYFKSGASYVGEKVGMNNYQANKFGRQMFGDRGSDQFSKQIGFADIVPAFRGMHMAALPMIPAYANEAYRAFDRGDYVGGAMEGGAALLESYVLGKPIAKSLKTLAKSISSKLNGETNIVPTKEDMKELGALPKVLANTANKQPSMAITDPKVVDDLGFYSEAERQTKLLQQNKGGGEQFKGMLLNKGVKADELDALGLIELFKQPKVTKQEILDTIEFNKVKLIETKRTGKGVDADDFDDETFTDIRREDGTTFTTADEVTEAYDTGKYIDTEITYDGMYDGTVNTHLPTGYKTLYLRKSGHDGENLQDIYLTFKPNADVSDWRNSVEAENYVAKIKQRNEIDNLDVDFLEKENLQLEDFDYIIQDEASFSFDEAKVRLRAAAINSGDYNPDEYTRFGNSTQPGGTNYKEYVLSLPPKNKSQTYQSGEDFQYKTHFPEYNPVFHIRTKDRTTPDGKKVLYVEELQSDWGQQGRERGFKLKGDDLEKAKAKLSVAEDNLMKLKDIEVKLTPTEVEDLYALQNPQTIQIDPFEIDVDQLKSLTPESNAEIVNPYNPPEGYKYGTIEEVAKLRQYQNYKALHKLGELTDEFFNQLDLSQMGRTQDEVKTEIIKMFSSGRLDMGSYLNYRNAPNEFAKPSENAKVKEANEIVKKYYKAKTQTRGEDAPIPDAPFVKDTEKWTGLAIKRLLQMAEKGGYDHIAFSPGKVQYQRWNEQGLVEYYDQIIPSVAQDVTRKMSDKSSNMKATTRDLEVQIPSERSIGISQRGDGKYFVNIQGSDKPIDNKFFNTREEAYDFADMVDEQRTNQKTFAINITPKVRDTARSGQAMFSLAAGLTAGASALSNQDVGALGSLPNDGT